MSFFSSSVRRMRRWGEIANGAEYSEYPDHAEQHAEEAPAPSRARAARCELLERIAGFFLQHDLAVTSENIALVCSALSGADARLGNAFANREISGEPINQDWLDGTGRYEGGSDDRRVELERLMDQMEDSLIRFVQTARSAHLQTSDHREAIDAQIAAMDVGDRSAETAGEVEQVIGLSRAMLRHLGEIENVMARSRAETEALRENLAMARMEAEIDHLTRLPNRRAFESRLARDVARARECGEALCVALCDIDHFKLVNDTHGHDAGDRILRMVAAMLNAIADESCFVARHGGEEFVVLLRGLDKAGAWRRIDRVRAQIARKQLLNRETGEAFGKITFSGGIAEVIEHGDPAAALAQADAALYAAKQAGRNRIAIG